MRAFGKLYVQVIIGVVLGIALGYAEPALATAVKPLGDAFIKAIKVMVAPIVFTTVVVGIATMGDLRRVASVGIKALIYFEVVSTLALLIGMIVGNVWPFGSSMNIDAKTLDAGAVASYVNQAKSLSITDFLLNIIPTTFIDPFAKGEILQILFVAVLFGLALCQLGERAKPLVNLLDQAAKGLFGMVRVIMYAAPIGAFAAIAFTVGKFGITTLLDLGEFVLAVFAVCLGFVVVVFGVALRLCGFRLSRVVGYFKEEILFVFAATSSEAMMPRCMEKLERLGCSKEVVGLVMPAGFSFNMDGAAIYMAMAVLFIAHATNIDLSWSQQLVMLFVMLFTSKGVVGVTGGGFVALAATLPAVGILPIGGLTLLLGVDRFMSEIRAAANLTSNIVATLVVARWSGAVDLAQAMPMLGTRKGRRAPLTDEVPPGVIPAPAE
ncbi:MAG TPA: C4-dicarboxylate transporter DctA [Xanthobacteraceae bacterium]|nr:C4-dicarboxylate transporter DctA [Xanthobacteraceae bacterium]